VEVWVMRIYQRFKRGKCVKKVEGNEFFEEAEEREKNREKF
jgi:hypothetical protein